MTTLELIAYYANLLIIQYLGSPRAYATIAATAAPMVLPQQSQQLISFSGVPTAGAFTLSYGGSSSSSMPYTDAAADVQTALRTITTLSSVTVSGSFTLGFAVQFVGVTGVASLLALVSNNLTASAAAVTVAVTETDQTLPIAVANGFDPLTAVGVQLDVIGKYQGVTRSGYDLAGNPITLDDADFSALINFAIIRNTSGSSLNDIQSLLFQFYPNLIYAFDYQNMHMSYLVSSTLGSTNLLQLLITENLLPKPMAVQLAVIIVGPVLNMFFGFRTYENANSFVTPFNDYASYQLDWPWLSYRDAITANSSLLTQSGNIIIQENGSFMYLG